MRGERWTAPVVALGFLGFAAGWSLLELGQAGSALSRAFAAQPEFRVWQFTIGLECAVWAMAVAPLVAIHQRLDEHETVARRTDLALSVVLLVGFAIAVAQQGSAWDRVALRPRLVARADLKNVLLIGACLVVSGWTLLSVWRVHGAIRALDRRMALDHRTLSDFVTLRATFESLLLIGTAIVAAFTLNNGARRGAYNRFADSKDPHFLAELFSANQTWQPFAVQDELLYAAALSLMLLVAVAPTYMAFVQVGQSLAHKLTVRPRGDEDWAAWLEQRGKLQGLLAIRIGAGAKTLIAIVAPIGTAALSQLLVRSAAP